MGYLSVDEVEDRLTKRTEPPYDTFTQLIPLPEFTWKGRKCNAIKIAYGTGPERIGVYFTGGVHAREWGSSDILVFFIEQLTQAYQEKKGIGLGKKIFSPDDIQKIVGTLDIFIFPQVNPDGREYSMTTDPAWIKNRRPEQDKMCPGVDINCNFNFLWSLNYFLQGVTNSSTDSCDNHYNGPSAASEPETKNVVSMLDKYPNIRFFIDLHSYGEIFPKEFHTPGERILYPWADDQNQSTDPTMNFQNPTYDGQRGYPNDQYKEYINAFDQALFVNLAQRMRDAIQEVYGRIYTVEQAFGHKAASGAPADYAYSRHFPDMTIGKVYSFIIEWGQGGNQAPFQPPYDIMEGIIEEVTAGLLEFCLTIAKSTDVCIKDNQDDTGAVPYTGDCCSYSDVNIRHTAEEQFDNQPTPALQGQPNYIFVKVTNLGPNEAQNVKVLARAVKYPGVVFDNSDLDSDWEKIDSTHLAPNVSEVSLGSIPGNGECIAKFELSTEQVDKLYGWQEQNWHPCLLAKVICSNDYGSPVGVHSWEDNNLAQRNITILKATAQATVSFPFVVDHPLDPKNSVGLVINRAELPPSVELWLDPFDPNRHFKGIPPLKPKLDDEITFLSRLRAFLCRCIRILASLFGLSFQCAAETAFLSMEGAEKVHRDGRIMLAVQKQRTTVQLARQPGKLHQAVLRFQVPASAKPGDKYRLHVSQQNEAGQAIGGVTLQVEVRREDLVRKL